MPRQLRYDYEGAFHHVYLRGARKNPIFRRDEDFFLFLGLLGEVVEKYGWEVHAFVLMLNHYHLLIRSMLANLSDCMRYLNGRFAQLLNERHDWDGPVFGGRFKNQNVENERYLRYLVAYIHLNPLRANLTSRLESEWWSSQRAYLGLERPPWWLSTSTVLELFGDRETLTDFTLGVHQGREAWPDGFDLESGFFGGLDRDAILLPRRGSLDGCYFRRAMEPEWVLAAVSAITGASRSELLESRAGRSGNGPRRFAVWALADSTLLRGTEIGELLGMTRFQVATTLHRARQQRDSEPMERWRRAWSEVHPPKW